MQIRPLFLGALRAASDVRFVGRRAASSDDYQLRGLTSARPRYILQGMEFRLQPVGREIRLKAGLRTVNTQCRAPE